MGEVKIEAPRGVGCGVGAVPPPQKNFAFLASKSHVCDALWHPFAVILILLLVENEQQCTKWFILQSYRQPNCSRIQVKTHSTTLAIAAPQWLVLRKSCELIVLRVEKQLLYIEVIVIKNIITSQKDRRYSKIPTSKSKGKKWEKFTLLKQGQKLQMAVTCRASSKHHEMPQVVLLLKWQHILVRNTSSQPFMTPCARQVMNRIPGNV